MTLHKLPIFFLSLFTALIVCACGSYRQVACPNSNIKHPKSHLTLKTIHFEKIYSGNSADFKTENISIKPEVPKEVLPIAEICFYKPKPIHEIKIASNNEPIQIRPILKISNGQNLLSLSSEKNQENYFQAPPDSLRRKKFQLPEQISDINIKGNEFGAASVFLAVMAFFIPLQLGITLAFLALIFGYAGIRQTKKTGRKKRAAIAGIVLAGLFMIMAIILLV